MTTGRVGAVVLTAAVIGVAGATLPGHADEKGEALLRQAAAAMGNARTLSAQIDIVRRGTGGGEDRRSGRVHLRKPNLARLDLGGRVPMTIVSTGRAVFMSNGQAYTYVPVKGNGGNIGEVSQAPLVSYFFQAENGSLAPGYAAGLSKPRYKGKEKVDGVSCDTLEMTGTKPTPCTVTLQVGPDGIPRRAVFRYKPTPRYEETVAVLLRGVAVNGPLPADAFRFNPAPGVKDLTAPTKDGNDKKEPAATR